MHRVSLHPFHCHILVLLMSTGFALLSVHPKQSVMYTQNKAYRKQEHLCYGLYHCTKNRKQTFQMLLEACRGVLTHHTHMAGPIQPSPVCSQRAQLATETEKKSMTIQICKIRGTANKRRISSCRELTKVAARHSSCTLLTGPDRSAGPRHSHPPAAPPPQEAAAMKGNLLFFQS